MSFFHLSKITIGVLLTTLLLVVVFQKGSITRLFQEISGSKTAQNVLSLVSRESFLPSPLRLSGSYGQSGKLTIAGVIKQTNKERSVFNLVELHESSKLNQMAKNKLDDMFAKQYFEHESPDGKGPSDLADAVGYKYLVVGENLAEGYFKDDIDLVQAWMDSPGHRANILHDKFQEIGVAVGQGDFEGKNVWLAVQSFGIPASACSSPSATDQKRISENKDKLDLLKLEAETARSQKDWNKYNLVVAELNTIIKESQVLIENYNRSVDLYNSCLEAKS